MTILLDEILCSLTKWTTSLSYFTFYFRIFLIHKHDFYGNMISFIPITIAQTNVGYRIWSEKILERKYLWDSFFPGFCFKTGVNISLPGETYAAPVNKGPDFDISWTGAEDSSARSQGWTVRLHTRSLYVPDAKEKSNFYGNKIIWKTIYPP